MLQGVDQLELKPNHQNENANPQTTHLVNNFVNVKSTRKILGEQPGLDLT